MRSNSRKKSPPTIIALGSTGTEGARPTLSKSAMRISGSTLSRAAAASSALCANTVEIHSIRRMVSEGAQAAIAWFFERASISAELVARQWHARAASRHGAFIGIAAPNPRAFGVRNHGKHASAGLCEYPCGTGSIGLVSATAWKAEYMPNRDYCRQ